MVWHALFDTRYSIFKQYHQTFFSLFKFMFFEVAYCKMYIVDSALYCKVLLSGETRLEMNNYKTRSGKSIVCNHILAIYCTINVLFWQKKRWRENVNPSYRKWIKVLLMVQRTSLKLSFCKVKSFSINKL